VREAWRLLHSGHEQLIDDVANGRRLIWLGSGISRDQVPDLVQLLARVLIFLRQRAGSGEADAAQHRAALLEILEDNLPAERERYEADPMGWEPGDLESLRDRYSRVLGVGVEGKPTDYLLIDGAGLPELYGDAALQPGPTHLILAMLISEGCATQFASGNWDGLIEKALSEISASESLMDVYVDVDDPRNAHGHAEIAKFHGCAVLALAQPDRYRGKIIATNAQISKLHGDPAFEHMKDHLRDLTTRKRSLILGLSVQDSDLLAIFQGAASRSPWPWDPSHPAYLFAEPAISASQRDVLEVLINEVFDQSLNALWAQLFTRFAPSERFTPRFVKQTAASRSVDVRLETELPDGRISGSPGAMLSYGNTNSAALALFMALHLSAPPELPWLIFDDPVQSMDDIHVANFAAIVRQLAFVHGRQVVIAVHQPELFDYLALELAPSASAHSLVRVTLDRGSGTTVADVERLSYAKEPSLHRAIS
jgi:hypothetical protein